MDVPSGPRPGRDDHHVDREDLPIDHPRDQVVEERPPLAPGHADHAVGALVPVRPAEPAFPSVVEPAGNEGVVEEGLDPSADVVVFRRETFEETVAHESEMGPSDPAAERPEDLSPELGRPRCPDSGHPSHIVPESAIEVLSEPRGDLPRKVEPPGDESEEGPPHPLQHHDLPDMSRNPGVGGWFSVHRKVELARDHRYRGHPVHAQELGEEPPNSAVSRGGERLFPPDPRRPVEDDRRRHLPCCRLCPEDRTDGIDPPLPHPLVEAAEHRVEPGDAPGEQIPDPDCPARSLDRPCVAHPERGELLCREACGGPFIPDEPGELLTDPLEGAEERTETGLGIPPGRGHRRLVREIEGDLDDREHRRGAHAGASVPLPPLETAGERLVPVGPAGSEPEHVAGDGEPLGGWNSGEGSPGPVGPEEAQVAGQAIPVRGDQLDDPTFSVRVGERDAEFGVRGEEPAGDQVHGRDREGEVEAQVGEVFPVALGGAGEADHPPEAAVLKPVEEDPDDVRRDRPLVLRHLVDLVKQDIEDPVPLEQGFDRVDIEASLSDPGTDGRERRVGHYQDRRAGAGSVTVSLELGGGSGMDRVDGKPEADCR
ncbi:hypothetical protein DSECCO2_586560 [anaerobic digester metagenome]